MPAPETLPPLLEYAAPQAFFEGVYRYRSWSGIAAALFFLVVGAACLFAWHVTVTLVGDLGPQRWVAYVMGICGAGLSVGAAVGFVHILLGTERVVRVTEHGITHGRRHWRWVRIERFGGMRYTAGIAITFRLRGRGHFQRTLVTTPMLTTDQFVELARTVHDLARKTKTNVTVVEEPEVPSSD